MARDESRFALAVWVCLTSPVFAFPASAAAANTYRRVGIAGETLPRAVSRRPHARGFTTAMSDSGSEDARELDLVGEEGDFADWEEENEEVRDMQGKYTEEWIYVVHRK